MSLQSITIHDQSHKKFTLHVGDVIDGIFHKLDYLGHTVTDKLQNVTITQITTGGIFTTDIKGKKCDFDITRTYIYYYSECYLTIPIFITKHISQTQIKEELLK